VESLAKLSEDLKKVYNLKRKVKASLTYPFIIFLFLFLAVIIVLVYVIPSITPLFANSDVELPAATQALMATSDFVKYNF
jgi:type II secretory pathway component PulF